MTCKATLGLAVLLLGTLSAAAADQPSPTGVWSLKQNNHEIVIDFTVKDTMTITAAAQDHGATVTCSYKVKDGVVKAKITQVAERGMEIKKFLPDDLEFTFTWNTKNDTSTLKDLKNNHMPDVLKPHLEGEYKRR